MLDPWIIEEIKRREDEKRRQDGAQRIRIHIERPDHHEPPPSPQAEEPSRGVTVIDL